jgi:hypothetical protein
MFHSLNDLDGHLEFDAELGVVGTVETEETFGLREPS